MILIPFNHDFLMFVWVVINRTLLGFVIGISALKVHWVFNGLIIGLTVGLVMPLNAIMIEKEWPLIISVYFMGIIYGILIEFFTSVVFKYKFRLSLIIPSTPNSGYLKLKMFKK